MQEFYGRPDINNECITNELHTFTRIEEQCYTANFYYLIDMKIKDVKISPENRLLRKVAAEFFARNVVSGLMPIYHIIDVDALTILKIKYIVNLANDLNWYDIEDELYEHIISGRPAND